MSDAMVGRTFDRWNVVSFAFVKGPHKYYNCKCECGTERPVQGWSMVYGKTLSCGCLRREVNVELHTTHGSCAHPAYKSWSDMKKRCQNDKMAAYKDYGGRGIIVCDAWQTFEGFWRDMGPTWVAGLTIERNDVNGNYEPLNCCWATKLEQAQNKRNSVLIDTPWGKLSQSAAARKAGISLGALIGRMQSGWPKDLWFTPSTRTP